MQEKTKNTLLNCLGSIFIIISIGSMLNTFFQAGLPEIFWMCYISTFLIGIGVITRKSQLIFAQIYILAIPLIIWNIDFIYLLITKQGLWNITNYFFTPGHNLLGKIFSLQHLFTIPASVYSVYLLNKKPSYKSLRISIIQVLIVYIATRFLTTPSKNANCVFESCIKFLPSPTLYPLAWIFVTVIGTLGTFMVVKLTILFISKLMNTKN